MRASGATDVVELGQGEQRLEQRGVVLGVGEEVGATVLPGTEQPAVVAAQLGEEEPGVGAGRVHPVGAIECLGGLGERAQEQRVPAEQHLVVEPRPDPLGACREQSRQHARDRFGSIVGRPDRVEDVAAEAGVRILEVPPRGHAEVADDVGERVAAERLELLEWPHVELALPSTLRVGVLGGEEAALRVAQVAQHVADGLLDDAAVAVGAGHQPPVQVRAHESAWS